MAIEHNERLAKLELAVQQHRAHLIQQGAIVRNPEYDRGTPEPRQHYEAVYYAKPDVIEHLGYTVEDWQDMCTPIMETQGIVKITRIHRSKGHYRMTTTDGADLTFMVQAPKDRNLPLKEYNRACTYTPIDPISDTLMRKVAAMLIEREDSYRRRMLTIDD